MPSFRRQTDVDRPIAEVWDVWSDVRLLPRFSKSTVEVRGAPEQLTAVGQTFTQVVRAVGRTFTSEWTVTELIPYDHLTIEGSVGFGVTYRLEEQVEALDDDRTRCTIVITYELPFGPLGRVAARLGLGSLAEREAGEVLAGVVALVEERAAAEVR